MFHVSETWSCEHHIASTRVEQDEPYKSLIRLRFQGIRLKLSTLHSISAASPRLWGFKHEHCTFRLGYRLCRILESPRILELVQDTYLTLLPSKRAIMQDGRSGEALFFLLDFLIMFWEFITELLMAVRTSDPVFCSDLNESLEGISASSICSVEKVRRRASSCCRKAFFLWNPRFTRFIALGSQNIHYITVNTITIWSVCVHTNCMRNNICVINNHVLETYRFMYIEKNPQHKIIKLMPALIRTYTIQ